MAWQPGDRVAWYRGDDHLTERQRYGTVDSDDGKGLTVVRWDDGRTVAVFTSYLEPEDEPATEEPA